MKTGILLSALFALPAHAAPPAPGSGVVMKVAVDPRIELLAAVHAASGYQEQSMGMGVSRPAYAIALRERFAAFRGHEAARLYRGLREGGFSQTDALFLLLSLTPPPALRPLPGPNPHREVLAQNAGGQDKLERFLRALSAFARDSGFAGFFAEHKGDYRRMQEALEKQLRATDWPGTLERYSGLRPRADYTWILTPGAESFAGTSKTEPGDPERVFSLLRVYDDGGGALRFDLNLMSWVVWHELGHVLLDRESEENAALLERSQALFSPIRERCYQVWPQCVREHVAKGLATRLWELQPASERDAARSPATSHEPLPYMPVVQRALKGYEAERGRYKTLADYYPRILEALALEARAPAMRTP